MDELLRELEFFVSLQAELLEQLAARAGVQKASSAVDALGRAGEFETSDGRLWSYQAHGGGVRFEARDGIVVDVHRELDSPGLFDLWRLRSYFGSLGKRGEKLLARSLGERGLSIGVALERAIAVLAEQGRLRVEGLELRLVQSTGESDRNA